MKIPLQRLRHENNKFILAGSEDRKDENIRVWGKSEDPALKQQNTGKGREKLIYRAQLIDTRQPTKTKPTTQSDTSKYDDVRVRQGPGPEGSPIAYRGLGWISNKETKKLSTQEKEKGKGTGSRGLETKLSLTFCMHKGSTIRTALDSLTEKEGSLNDTEAEGTPERLKPVFQPRTCAARPRQLS